MATYGPSVVPRRRLHRRGPWFHGAANFHGHVDNHFDPNHGYHGPMPGRGERPTPEHPAGHVEHFHGNEVRDGRGHSH